MEIIYSDKVIPLLIFEKSKEIDFNLVPDNVCIVYTKNNLFELFDTDLI